MLKIYATEGDTITKSDEIWEKYRKQRNDVVRLREESKRIYIKKGCTEAKNFKDFWNSVGPMLSGKSKGSNVNISLVESGDT